MFCNCIPCICKSTDTNEAPKKLFKVSGVLFSREDHFYMEAQTAYRTWGLECAICSKSLADLYGTEKPRLNCGHWFCNDCMQKHIKWKKMRKYNQLRCPMCRKAVVEEAPVISLRAIPRTIKINLDDDEV
ncbi:55b76a7b-5861-4f6a-9a19-b6ff60881c03 [Sclerotinia trifoliorum]|uniref:55b76a7b-5861-4f6a-9a19-b6ff60881c03 n=1 Tax=Sclerotinia trifoliorum TaxID=28548 RepID=A0A8H2VX37_9HELO|nr:55b76a7b-5861-4f6a-9a19-b6ff60881c03 [Sclerotinia trifoliorum]